MIEKHFEGRVPVGEVYNIGNTTTTTISDMLDKVLHMSETEDKVEVRVEQKRLRPIDVTLQIPCTDKFKEATGWKPIIPFEQTMQDLLDYCRRELRSQRLRVSAPEYYRGPPDTESYR